MITIGLSSVGIGLIGFIITILLVVVGGALIESDKVYSKGWQTVVGAIMVVLGYITAVLSNLLIWGGAVVTVVGIVMMFV